MNELEIELNEKGHEWIKMQEQDKKLLPVYGPKFTGIHNLGNSCYMNVILHLLIELNHVQQHYAIQTDEINRLYSPTEAASNFSVQFSKLAKALVSGEYSQTPLHDMELDLIERGIRPKLFRSIIGRNHIEFSTKKQQDAHEFLLYVLEFLDKSSKTLQIPSATEAIKFRVQERLECTSTHKVSYKTREEIALSLPVPSNVSNVSLMSCLEEWNSPEIINDFYSTALKQKTSVLKTTSFLTFPDNIIFHARRFTLTENWTPKKLDVELEMPDIIDLNSFRVSKGLQQGEESMPEELNEASSNVTLDESIISELNMMGFPTEASKRAAYETRNLGTLESAVEWAMSHVGDENFSSPFEIPAPSNKEYKAKPEDISMLTSLGFTNNQAIKALKATDNNVERAADYALSHVEELNNEENIETISNIADGPGIYELVGFVSHMGPSTNSGHYVWHVKRENAWFIFNDEKVALSQNPPIKNAYLYLYKRIQF